MLNRKGLLKLVGNHTRESFVRLYLKSCVHCNNWGDLAVSKMIRDSKVKLESMKGLHPWRLGKPQFIDQVRSSYPPITFHYMRNLEQLQTLYRMFSPSQRKQSAKGEKAGRMSDDKQYGCVTYEGRKVCAKSGADAHVPWR